MINGEEQPFKLAIDSKLEFVRKFAWELAREFALECKLCMRNSGDLQIPKVRLEYAKRSFYFSGVKN